jgi:hypothetical protein
MTLTIHIKMVCLSQKSQCKFQLGFLLQGNRRIKNSICAKHKWSTRFQGWCLNWLINFFLLQLEFFTTFKAKYLEAKIQFVPKVEALVCASTQNWNTCCYHYHKKFKKFMHGINNMRISDNNISINCCCRCNEVCQ